MKTVGIDHSEAVPTELIGRAQCGTVALRASIAASRNANRTTTIPPLRYQLSLHTFYLSILLYVLLNILL